MARTTGSNAEQTRHRVLDAALELFFERGYAGTSIRDIAERVDVTKAALYYHFPAKEDLLRALIAPFAEELAACARAAEQESQSAELLIRRLVDVFDEYRHLLLSSLYDPSVRQVLIGQDGLFAELASLERTLAGSTDLKDLLRVRCAIGAIRGAFVPSDALYSLVLDERPVVVGARLSDAEREAVARAALAALRSK